MLQEIGEFYLFVEGATTINYTSRNSKKMKIAVPTKGMLIDDHFGIANPTPFSR